MERLVSQIERSFADVEQELADPAVLNDHQRLAEVGRTHRRLQTAHELARRWRAASQTVQDAEQGLESESDPEVRAYLQEELESSRAEVPALEEELRIAMLEHDPAVAARVGKRQRYLRPISTRC